MSKRLHIPFDRKCRRQARCGRCANADIHIMNDPHRGGRQLPDIALVSMAVQKRVHGCAHGQDAGSMFQAISGTPTAPGGP